ncbi:MAG: shikimate dehydrogenase [Comamonadaceae bacterium]|nr:MAG: shikimate dehydrogenase [Comamonadaceae bacterium]
MDRYCVMGNPVDHSKSPWIHARFAELTGEPVEYGKRLVPMDGFEEGLRAFRAEGGKGCNVTVPFKFEAARLADFRSARAALAGACNVLRFEADGIHGENTDGIGLVADLQRNAGISLGGRDVLLVGAGGAAAGVLGPLLEARPRRIVVANRTVEKAQALVQRHAMLANETYADLQACALHAVRGAFDVVLNATATSMAGTGVPVDAAVLKPGALACDMMYGPAAQGFLDWAREHGAVGRDGLGMLVEQAAEAFQFWRGIRPPSAQVLAELRREMER